MALEQRKARFLPIPSSTWASSSCKKQQESQVTAVNTRKKKQSTCHQCTTDYWPGNCEEIICASTYRLVDLEDVWRRVEVSVELINDYVETTDLLSHGAGHLDETLAFSYSTSAQEQAGLVFPTSRTSELKLVHWIAYFGLFLMNIYL